MNDDGAGDEAQRAQSVKNYLVAPVPVAGFSETVGAVRDRIIGEHYEDASHVFVLAEDGRLVGVAAIRDILAAAQPTLLTDLARDAKSYSVSLDANREQAASQAIHAGLSILAVCDAQGACWERCRLARSCRSCGMSTWRISTIWWAFSTNPKRQRRP